MNNFDNLYEFRELNDNPVRQERQPELLVDSILVFLHRLCYFFMCAAAYISFFIFNSLTVGRTLACTAAILYLIDAVATFLLIHLSARRTKMNGQINDMAKALENLHEEVSHNNLS